MDAAEVADLLEKTDETEILDKILEADKERVASFKTREKARFDDGHKKGVSETLNKFEKSLREKYEIPDADLQGEELIEAIVTKKAPEKQTSKTITVDDIKKSPAYIDMQREFDKKIKETNDQWQTKLSEQEKSWNRDKTLTSVKEKALEYLAELNPELPADPKIAAKHKQWFLNELEQYEYEVQPDGSLVVKDKEGKPAEDAHGAMRSFTDIVKDHATQSFTFAKSQSRTAPANGGGTNQNQGGGGSGKTLPKPKTLDELTGFVNSKDYTQDEKSTIIADYEKAGGAVV